MQAALQPYSFTAVRSGNSGRTVTLGGRPAPAKLPQRRCQRVSRLCKHTATRVPCTFQLRRHASRPITVATVFADGQDSGLDNSRKARLQRQGQASLHFVRQAWRLLKDHLWPVLLIFILCDAAAFATNRISHRLTNEVAMRALGLHAEDIGPLWWLSTNPAVTSSGYRWIIAVFFVAAFPLTILARTIATSATALLCCKHPSTPAEAGVKSGVSDAAAADATGAKNSLGIRATMGHMLSTVRLLQPGVAAVWKRVFVVDMLVTVQVLPLQLASLLLLTLPWTLPRLLDLQAANPVAVLDGQEGWQAIARSKDLIQPLRAAVALPFLGLIVISRILDPLRLQVMAALPTRYYRELPEIPIALYIGFQVASVIVNRMHDLLPVVVYQQGQHNDPQPARSPT
ncbi:TPA: hypothetical protein ACH3X2_013154 [Trebouxia sp. C0005]